LPLNNLLVKHFFNFRLYDGDDVSVIIVVNNYFLTFNHVNVDVNGSYDSLK